MNVNDYVTIDIETMPNMDMVDRLPEPEVKYGNTKDEAKRQIKYEEAVRAQIDKMALNPLYGKVACVGYKLDGIVGSVVSENEVDLLEFYFNELFEGIARMPKIVTWNGMGFDVPFLYKRALVNGVVPRSSMSHYMKRYSNDFHCDLMQVWCNWYGYEKLTNVASVLLDESKEDFDITTIKDLVKTDEGKQKIANYCEKDVSITAGLFEKMANVLF